MEQVAKNIHIPYSQKVRDSSSDSEREDNCDSTSNCQGLELYKRRVKAYWKIEDHALREKKLREAEDDFALGSYESKVLYGSFRNMRERSKEEEEKLSRAERKRLLFIKKTN